MADDMQFSADELAHLNDLACALLSTRTFSQLADAVLDMLPLLVPHGKSFLTREPNQGGNRKQLLYTHTMSAEELNQYDEIYAEHDYSAWYLAQGNVAAYRDTDLVSEAAMARSRIFNEWVRPMGMYYVGGAVFHAHGERMGDIALFRCEEDGDFSDRELFLLSLVAQLVDRWLETERPAAASAPAVAERGADLSVLTERELEVARLACTGMSVRQMSDYLAVSYGTARRHLANIYEKLGIGSRVQLIEAVGR